MWKRVMIATMFVMSVACDAHHSAKTVESPGEAGVRTGKVSNIVIDERVTPDTLTVRAGDEVRWLNHHQRPVVVELTDPIEGKVSCQSGFSEVMGTGMENSATIGTNGSAGLCFNRIGTVHYTVRAEDSDHPRALKKTQGTITVQ